MALKNRLNNFGLVSMYNYYFVAWLAMQCISSSHAGLRATPESWNLPLLGAVSDVVGHAKKYAYLITQCCFSVLNFERNTASGCKVFLMYFFVLISNLESKLKNLCRVFFKWHFKILIDYKKFNIWYFYFFLHFLWSKIDSEQKSIPANFHKNW